MKKLIHIDDHSSELICDSPTCDFVAAPGAYVFGPHLIGMPCPKCGDNLLTEIDYKNQMKSIKFIEWINWFGNLLGLGSEVPPTNGEKISVRSVNGEFVIKQENFDNSKRNVND